jgi:CRISPR-associated endonuclease/helicase Cas3
VSAAFAHSEGKSGERHSLVAHLRAVAERAAEFADAFGAGELAYWAGLWHDLGKFHPDFQAYLDNAERRRGPDHSSAGAVQAAGHSPLLPFLIAGHHAGLPEKEALRARLAEKGATQAVELAVRRAREELGSIDPAGALNHHIPHWLQGAATTTGDTERLQLSLELFLRMTFSALVDADFLDTEGHFDPDRAGSRAPGVELATLWPRMEAHHAGLLARPETPVNELRNEIYDQCLQAADSPPGLFRLTVPTGGGKTLSGMAFALRHSLAHDFRRVVFAIPYTSIIEQTADEYRGVFGDVVLEHHSAVRTQDISDPVSYDQLWPRLASENWDAPVVVTTTVQLFESMFANRPSACRKLHNLAGSILVLDEVQTLPPGLLEPILDALRELVLHYHMTVVFCTATQPSLTTGRYADVLADAREIVPKPDRYFLALQRVYYEVPAVRERWSCGRVAEEMRSATSCLAVVNTKADAMALLAALDDPDALHLSTNLCGAHRRAVLTEVGARLNIGCPCRVVSTQVVEAGVDLDFPLVLRAIGPLDRIVQAAGRANREGRLGPRGGRVVVFEPVEGKTPPGAYRTGADLAGSHLRAGCDLHDPATYRRYFEELYRAVELDQAGIQKRRMALDYPAVAERFRLIEDEGMPVIVNYRPAEREIRHLVRLISAERAAPRWVFRRLQPFVVNLRRQVIEKSQWEGLIDEIVPGLWLWSGKYDNIRGLEPESFRDPESLIVATP